MSHDDMALVREFAAGQSEPAFAALVERHISFVHSAALRRVGDPQLAEEITQAVFILLARKAGTLGPNTILPGWLYRTTRYVAADALKIQRRRERREQEAFMQSTANEPETPVWRDIAPLLESAMDALNDPDRNAVLLRFFEDKTLAEVAAATGVSEDAARVRVNRAVEKLHRYFAKRGISSTTAILAGAIANHSVQIAPVALTKAVTAAALAQGATASTSTLTLIKGALKIMAWTQTKTAVVVGIGILATVGTTTVAVKEIVAHRTPSWQEKFDLSLLDRLPPQATILPSLPSTVRSHFNAGGARNGKMLCLGQTFLMVLEGAYNAVQSRFIVDAPMPEGRYDYVLTYPRMEDNMTALQRKINQTFGVTVRHEMIETNILILTVESPNAPGLKPSARAFQNSVASGSYSIRGATLFTLVADLENSLGTVVVDETKARGKFDIDLKWDSTPDGLKKALHDELGLKLTPSRKTVGFFVVEKAK